MDIENHMVILRHDVLNYFVLFRPIELFSIFLRLFVFVIKYLSLLI